MLKNLYTVQDIVGNQLVGGIIQEIHDAPAIRAFYDALRAENSMLAQHPADFNLLQVGNIDIETGDIVPTTPKIVATGNGWLEMQKGL